MAQNGFRVFHRAKMSSQETQLNTIMATNPSPSSYIPVGLNFLFHNFENKIRNWAMLFNETLIKLFDADIGFKRIILLDSFNCFVMKKNDIFSTSTHILESVYVPGDTISGVSKVNTKAIK